MGSLSGPGRELKTGDSFALVCLSGLPFTPTLQARGRLVHLARGAGEPYAGMALEGLAEGDVKARVLRYRASIHSYSCATVSLLPAPSTPEMSNRTGNRACVRSSRCAWSVWR